MDASPCCGLYVVWYVSRLLMERPVHRRMAVEHPVYTKQNPHGCSSSFEAREHSSQSGPRRASNLFRILLWLQLGSPVEGCSGASHGRSLRCDRNEKQQWARTGPPTPSGLLNGTVASFAWVLDWDSHPHLVGLAWAVCTVPGPTSRRTRGIPTYLCTYRHTDIHTWQRTIDCAIRTAHSCWAPRVVGVGVDSVTMRSF
jgi:hypothetical protein